MNLRRLLVLSINFSILSLFGFTSCNKGKTENNAARANQGSMAVGVEGYMVNPREITHNITSTGNLLANEEIEVRPEISGRITGIYFDEGSPVKKGQLLVKINDSDLQAQLKKLELQKKLATDEEFRSRRLLEIKAISQEEYDLSLNRLNTAEAEIDLLQAELVKTRIYAPFTGVIGLRYASEGGFISSSGLIATMQQLNPIKIEFTIPEQYGPKIKEGTKIKFSVSGIDDVYEGEVYAVESAIDLNTRSIRIRAKSQNPENNLKPGAFARVEIALEKFDSALMVPSESIVPELNGQKVFVSKNGFALEQRVKVGVRTEREVQILEGLSSGDTLITTGLMSLKDSTKVTIKNIRQPKKEIEKS